MSLVSIRCLAAAGVAVSLEPSAQDVARARVPETKRVVDVVVAAALLVALSPLLLLLAALVEGTSRGAAFRGQWRIGRGGRLFRMYSLRTTLEDERDAEPPIWSERAAPRVTIVGRALLATRLDALPQLVNVLKGDMSFVGPRAERPDTARGLACLIPNYAARLAVRPGMTGLAQVRARGEDSTRKVRRMLAEDLLYVRRMSLALDAAIVARSLAGAFTSPLHV